MEDKTGGPAFPMPSTFRPDGEFLEGGFFGMSKRDVFAGMAMQGLCCTASPMYDKGQCNSAIVERSIILADRLIAALKGDETNG